jgi:hypothetical protein
MTFIRREVEYLGVNYKSTAEFAREWNMARRRVSFRLTDGKKPKQIIEELSGYQKPKKPEIPKHIGSGKKWRDEYGA